MKQKTKQLQSSGETRKTNRTWHFLSTLNSLLLSKFLLLLIIPAIGSTAAWGASGDVLFSQNFNSATEVPYANNTAVSITSSSGNNIVGTTATSQFSFIGITGKDKAGIAINSATGGNSVSAEGIFRAYCNNTGQNWSLVHNTGFAATAPTALKVSMKIFFTQLSSGSDYSVSFAVGDGFSNATSGPATSDVHSGFSIKNNSSATLTQYRTNTDFIEGKKSVAITQSDWQNVTWVINNTGSALVYDDPASGTSTVDNGCFDLWIGTTKVLTNKAATTATKTLQNLYIGDPAGKKNCFQLDDLVVTDLTPGDGSTFTLTNAVSPTGYGTVSPTSVSGILSETTTSSSSNTYTVGTTDVTATPASETAEYTYSFVRWDDLPATVTESGTVTAVFSRTPKSYTLAWDSNEGDALTGSYTSGSTAYGTALTQPNTPTRSGYTFLGWNTSADGKGSAYTGTMPAATTTYYAQWQDNSAVTVTYNLTVNSSNTTLDNCVSATPTSGDVVASTTIYTNGTAGAASSNSAKSAETQKLKIDGTYNADNYYEWKFTVGSDKMFTPSRASIKFQSVTNLVQYKVVLTDGNTSYETTFVNTSYAADTPQELAWNITPTKGLKGTVSLKVWAYKANDAATAFRLASPITITGSVETAATLYSVSFEDGTCGDHGTYTSTPVTQATEGDNVILPSVAADTGYTFSGWNTAADGTGASYAAGLTTYNPTRDHTLYAIYTAKTYNVTINDHGATSPGTSPIVVTYNADMPEFNAPVKTGSVLKGYYTAESAGTKIINADGTLVESTDYSAGTDGKWTYAGNVTLHAQWDAVFTVTFDANGGTCSTASLTQSAPGASIILPVASKEGAAFAGWYDADGVTLINGAGEEYTPTSNITLYAHYNTSSTNFHLLTKTSTGNMPVSAGETKLTESDYAVDVDGGEAYYCNNNSSRDYKNGMKLGGDAEYLKLVLNNALAVGDVISFDQGTQSIAFTKTSTRDVTYTVALEGSYTVTAGDGLVDASTIWVWRAKSTNTYVREISITSSAENATYTVSFDTDGIADDIDDLTEQETLPNPLPTPTNVLDGYTFEGWYTNSGLTTRATAGAAIAANTTLYANYIIDTPTITPASGAIYANAPMTLTSSVSFTRVYGGWKHDDNPVDKQTAIDSPGTYQVYPSGGSPSDGAPIDTYNFTCWENTEYDNSYFAYMISDGKYFSRPVVSPAFTVSQLITITSQPSSAVYVQKASASALEVVAEVTGGGKLSYQWKSSTDNTSWSDISTSSTYTPSTTATGTTYYKCIVSSDNGATPVETNVVSVTVNASARFTVSFDKGIGGVATEVESIQQPNAGDEITLPNVTLKAGDASGARYQFAGWYDEDGNSIGSNGDGYTPSGDITLYAKYNCRVLLQVGLGDGNVPTAVIKSTGAAVESGDFVFEGTTLTLTASPAADFIEWKTGMTGTDNPKDYTVNDYKTFVADYRTSEYSTLFHTDFISGDGWTNGSIDLSKSYSIKGAGMASAATVTFGCSKGHTTSVNTSTGKLTFDSGDNLTASAGNVTSTNPNHYMAIHLTGVNGSITVDFGSASQKWLYTYDDGNDGTVVARVQLGDKATSFTIDNLLNNEVTLYITNKNVSISELTITTPKTKLVANPSEVSFVGTSKTADVRIVTNSSGTVSATSGNNSVATASYNPTTKMVTVTPGAAGETEIKVEVAANGAYPAKEITIPVTVEDAAITIKTQPSNITCTQNDVADKTFTVVATVNTGNELTYQWYTCNSDGTGELAITGATSDSYTLNTTQKATKGTTYYKCKVTSATDGLNTYTAVRSVTVSELTDGQTYSAIVFVGDKGNSLTYTGLGESTAINAGSSTGIGTYISASISSGTLTIGSKAVGTAKVVLNTGTTINVTVKKHTILLKWSKDVFEKDVTGVDAGTVMPIDNGSTPTNLPYLIRLYEDGTNYDGTVTFHVDDTSMAYFTSPGTDTYEQTNPANKPNIYYAGGQGGCKFYAYIAGGNDAEDVKAAYDLRLMQGYSNSLPNGRKVEVQQQYTLYKPDTDEKLITVTYGGYKYNDHKWTKGTDTWGTASAIVSSTNATDGFYYAVRNEKIDAADEYEHALQDVDNNDESAWYAIGEGGATENYQRIKPFRLPCRGSYVTFTAHESGTLTAYVYQNGVIGRGSNKNQLSSGPRLGYWFDEEGWVQHPVRTVVTKQKIANGNARDTHSYDSKDLDAQLGVYWTNTDDEIVVKMLKSRYCKSLDAAKLKEKGNYEVGDDEHPIGYTGEYREENPYYWGKTTFVTANNKKVVPTPERPIPHQNGHMIVNEGYVKYTINVTAGKTYYFFGKMTKVGYAGMTFMPADSENENRQTSPVHLTGSDKWSEKFDTHASSVLVGNETTIYDKITLPSNYRIGKWNTICLPFSVNENQVEEVFGKGTELAIFNGLRHDTENHVYYIKYLRHVDQNILPGQPYLIYPTGRAVAERTNQENGGMAETGETIATVGDIIGSTVEGQTGTRLTFKNVLINKGITAQSYGCNLDADGITTSYEFKGTDQPLTIEKYDLYNTPKTGGLARWMSNNSTNLNSYHALIKANDSQIKQDAITFTFSEDDVEKAWDPTTWRSEDDDVDPGEATGIVIIEDVTDGGNYSYAGRAANGKTYNLMGQEVDARSAKGIVISNGKKIMY